MGKSFILLCYLPFLLELRFQIQSFSWFLTEMKKAKLYLLSKMMAEIDVSDFVSDTQCGNVAAFLPLSFYVKINFFGSF